MAVVTGDTITEAVVGRTDWAAVTFQNSWVNFGSGRQNVEYRKTSGDMVQIRGTMKSGTLGSTAFTLPSGFRPPAALNIAGGAWSGSAAVAIYGTINTDGTFIIAIGTNNEVPVNFSFSTVA